MSKRSLLGQRILLTLLGLTAAGLCYSPRQQRKIFREIGKLWHDYDDRKTEKQVESLYKSKLIERKSNKDGTITIKLTDKGKVRALTYRISEMRLQKNIWDGKWRIIFFDIPEKQRVLRDIFRQNIKNIGFCEIQKSVFAFPYECEKEAEFLIEFYKIRKWTRFAVLEKIDDDSYLRKFFEI